MSWYTTPFAIDESAATDNSLMEKTDPQFQLPEIEPKQIVNPDFCYLCNRGISNNVYLDLECKRIIIRVHKYCFNDLRGR